MPPPAISKKRRIYEPFYSLRHGSADDTQKHFWYTHRRPSFRKNDNGTDVYLSLVDLDFNPALPPVEMLTLHVTCTNRDQAPLLKLSGEFGELEPEGAALMRARCLRKPTPTVRPPARRGSAVAPDLASFAQPSVHRGKGNARRCRKSSGCTIFPTIRPSASRSPGSPP